MADGRRRDRRQLASCFRLSQNLSTLIISLVGRGARMQTRPPPAMICAARRSPTLLTVRNRRRRVFASGCAPTSERTNERARSQFFSVLRAILRATGCSLRARRHAFARREKLVENFY